MIRFNTVVFDLDGTLVDSEKGIKESFKDTLEELGLPPTSLNLIEIGPPIAKTINNLIGDQTHRFEEVLNCYRKHYAQKGVFEAHPYPGIVELLEQLHSQNIKLSIATAKLEKFAKILLEQKNLAKYFEGRIYGSGPQGEFSQKADLLKMLIEKHSFDKTKLLMVGDRLHDVFAARENFCSSAGVLWGFGSRQELEKAGAEFIVSSANELAKILDPKWN